MVPMERDVKGRNPARFYGKKAPRLVTELLQSMRNGCAAGGLAMMSHNPARRESGRLQMVPGLQCKPLG
jgi:hypothetical protein